MSAPLHIIVHVFKHGEECYPFFARSWADNYPIEALAKLLEIPYDEESCHESLSHFIVDNGIQTLDEPS